MNRLKEYENLYKLYRRSQTKRLLLFAVFFGLFVLSFLLMITDVPFDIIMVMMLMIMPAIAVGIICLVMRRMTAKSLARFTSDELRRIDSAVLTIPMQRGFGVTRDALVSSKGRLFLYPVKDILWIYKHVDTTKLYGIITVSKISSVVIAGKDKKRYDFIIKNKSNIVEFLQKELQPYRKGIIYGYAPELDKMFNKEFDKMVSSCEEYEREHNEF
ncbi:MAG: hypothetical protein J1E35_03555 [Lachnospiraceae bacterium]|nr:hypothetical protein [Lachnospiraceae bacterium]